VAIKDLPAAFDGYRVLQLTDIHASRLLTGDWVRRVVDESNALKPDLIVTWRPDRRQRRGPP
jgi:predicted MPP superfamily phosphohydrolase